MRKCIQSEFAFSETVSKATPPKPEYIPPAPRDMTNEELEKWYLVKSDKAIRREIMARIKDGVKFRHFEVVQYLGMKPMLRIHFHD